MKKIFCTIILFFLFFQAVSAHTLGQSLEKEVDGYFMDIGYSATDKIYTGESIRFDFNLWEKDRLNIAGFDHVWVRISPDDFGLSFAGFLYYPKPLLTGMSYTFEKAGNYDLTVRFLDKNDKTMAEATFPLLVVNDSSDRTDLFKVGSSAVAGLIIGLFISKFLKRKMSQIQ